MLKGSLVALITPFLENGDIDFNSFRKLISWQIEQGSDGLVICGSTGEASTLSFLEQQSLIIEAVKEAKGQIPIIAGTGTNDTRTSVERTKAAKEAGANACLVIFPYYNRPTFEGCFRHLESIAKCDLPIILYHHPGRTGLRFSAKELAEFAEIPQVIALKEASGDVEQACEFMRLSSKDLFSGDDSLSLPLISAGAKGSISIIGNLIPQKWSLFIKKCLEGKIQEARDLYSSLAPLCKAMVLETNPQCIKYAMSLDEHCAPFMRLPLILPQEKTRKEIESLTWRN